MTAGVRPFLCAALALGLAVPTAVAAQPPGGRFQCIVEPYAVVELGSPVEGVLESVGVERGERVSKGDVVARLEASVEKALVEVARARAETDIEVRAGRARLGFQAARLERNEELARKDVVSASSMDESRTDMTVAELALEEAERNVELARLELERAKAVLNLRTVRSPMNGVVVERFLEPGEYVSADAPLLRLARMDLLFVEAFMKIEHYGNVERGMRAEVFPQPPVGGRHPATVTSVDSLLDAASGTFRVRLTLENADLALPAGIRCELAFLPQ